jgi:cytochrome c oxidase subunit 4
MEHSSPGLRIYFLVYIVLILLVVLTVAVAEMHLGGWGIVIAMAIASVKAILVLLYFMHLRYSSRLVWLFAISGFVWLLILIFYVISDYVSRGWVGSTW